MDIGIIQIVPVADIFQQFLQCQLALVVAHILNGTGIDQPLQLRFGHAKGENAESALFTAGQDRLHIKQHSVLCKFSAAIGAEVIVCHQ